MDEVLQHHPLDPDRGERRQPLQHLVRGAGDRRGAERGDGIVARGRARGAPAAGSRAPPHRPCGRADGEPDHESTAAGWPGRARPPRRRRRAASGAPRTRRGTFECVLYSSAHRAARRATAGPALAAEQQPGMRVRRGASATPGSPPAGSAVPSNVTRGSSFDSRRWTISTCSSSIADALADRREGEPPVPVLALVPARRPCRTRSGRRRRGRPSRRTWPGPTGGGTSPATRASPGGSAR